jgi:hypothetical protein
MNEYFLMSARYADHEEGWQLYYQSSTYSNACPKVRSASGSMTSAHDRSGDTGVAADLKDISAELIENTFLKKPELPINHNKSMKSKQFLLVFRREYKSE